MNYDLLIAFLSVSAPFPGHQVIRDTNWKALFDFYNANKSEEEQFLGMSCRSCFDKVYLFCRRELLKKAVIMRMPPVDIANLSHNKQDD